MNTLHTWVSHSLVAARTPASFYSGNRKIIRPYHFTFPALDSSLTLSSAGYTTNKLKALIKHYHHVESQNVAVALWSERRVKNNYGSVSFTTFNHFVKGDVHGHTPRGSKFGPCLQSVVLTHLNRNQYCVDVFYRSTELFKKFAPDLVLVRDVLLQPFDTSGLECTGITFHFANLTAHPMYICTLFPHLRDPIAELERLRKADKHFYNWAVKWSARYLVPKYFHGIEKFAQALRVQMDVQQRLSSPVRKELAKYLTKNHPGYTRSRFEEEQDDPD